jgi:hypothetical protein
MTDKPDQSPDTTTMMGLIPSEWAGLEEPSNSTTDVAEPETEVMRITRNGVWVNPDLSVDDTAKAVLAALDSHLKVLVEKAVQAEREWIGLTDADKIVIRGSVDYNKFMSAAEYVERVQDATEAKLKEKNT